MTGVGIRTRRASSGLRCRSSHSWPPRWSHRLNSSRAAVIATALVPHLGYETTAAIIKESNRTGKSIRQVVRARKLMTGAELDRALDVEAMTRGGIIE